MERRFESETTFETREIIPRLAEASENLLANLPILVCGLVMSLALVHEWVG